MPLKGRLPSVTGAGSGFGREIALQMAGEEARIGVNDADGGGIAKTLQTLEKAGGERLAPKADVGNPVQVKEMLESLRMSWGTVDILLNNTGIAILPAWEDYE